MPAGSAYDGSGETVVSDAAPPIHLADCSLEGSRETSGADLDGARQRADARQGGHNAMALGIGEAEDGVPTRLRCTVGGFVTGKEHGV